MPTTQENLKNAFAGESMANRKYLAFAKQAEKIPTIGKVPDDIVENMDYYTWGGKKGE